MNKKAESGQPLAHFDEHGMFELDAELTHQVGAGLKVPNVFKRIGEILGPGGTNNHVCLSPNLTCGGNTHC